MTPLMTPLELPTLPASTPREVTVAFTRLHQHAQGLAQQVTELQRQLTALPAPLSLDEIRAALQANGSHPLSAIGLIGSGGPL